ncbi:5'-3' exonuclease [Chengkuizengella marina]|uniref:5'-3' exonuclease n=1 Tax=Chengkuizengella marina TaxID=2507566 RepID=A0A6N9Q670_9BACL|nr:5'-3' exonuclease H3TH domain-containing protein [Chengkuizengella marina]NBI30270.1 5'-3' exonuclease [Chengkuizengella marina]
MTGNNHIEDQENSILIIDSFALLFRGFYATAVTGNYMRNSQGLYTNGLYQFTRYMLDAIERFKPTHVICAFDMGEKTFRNDMYSDYKANRGAPPEELVPQFGKLWELVEAFEIPCMGKVGYEADDMIGSIAKYYSNQGIEINVLTGDKDTLQLINEKTNVTLMKKGFGNYLTIGMDNFKEETGVTYPYQIIEMKGLMGDASDNIPGCPKVGPKTAIKLIDEFENINQLFENIDQVKGKLQERLLENKELIYLSRELATIHTDVTFQCHLDDCTYVINQEKLIHKLKEFEFKSLIRKFAV